MLPTISVVIPTYNGETWITDTLQSVFEQTLLPTEVIVVDDDSTDSTPQQVSAVSQDSPVPVTLIRNDKNSGSPGPTLNIGLARASGELVAVLDQDDLFVPTKLELQSRVLAVNAELSLVFSLFDSFGKSKQSHSRAAALARVRGIRRRMTLKDGYLCCDGSIALEEFARSINFVGGFPGFMFRRSAWLAKGGFDESLKIAADYEFLCWLCTQGAVGFIPEFHYRRREHGANLTLRTGVGWRLDAITVLLRYAKNTGTIDIQTIVRNTIEYHLWAVARRLASAGQWQAAAEVSKTVQNISGASWTVPAQKLAIPAYVAYYRVFRRPWRIRAEQAQRATELAKIAKRQLA